MCAVGYAGLTGDPWDVAAHEFWVRVYGVDLLIVVTAAVLANATGSIELS